MSFAAPLVGALGGIGTIAAVAGTGLSVLGSIQQSRAQSAAAEQNAAIAQQNAELSRRQANQEANDTQEEGRRRLATIKSQFAKSGIAFTGSTLDVLESQQSETEKDVGRILYNGQIQTNASLDEASRQKSRASSIKQAGLINAASGLLTGASQLGTLK